MELDKYRLYQLSVQDPENDIEIYRKMAAQLRPEIGKSDSGPLMLREDFCGTFAMSCEWLKLSPNHHAMGLDLDPEPLAWGKKHNLSLLKPEQKKRLTLLQQNVISTTQPLADLIIAGNFSFFIFKERKMLVDYFKNTARSLKKGGLHFLEFVGGPGFLSKMRERKTIKPDKGPKFLYIWEQKGYDPVTAEANYAIHFKHPKLGELKNAFTYPWRIWNIREVREAMLEAGFSKTHVFWENEKAPEELGAYTPAEKGADDHAWICYVVGQR